MVTRIISGAVVAALTVLIMIFGGNVLGIALLAVSLIAYRELVSATGVRGDGTLRLLEAVGYIGIVVYYGLLILYNGQFSHSRMGIPLFFLLFMTQVVILMVMLAVYVFTFPRYDSHQVMAAYFCFLYGPVMLSFIYLTERLALGRYAVWMIFISSWVCDTCAYFTGMMLGRHKMAPVLSPKKTVEGAIGGIVGSAVLGLAFCMLVMRTYEGAGGAFHFDVRIVFAGICAVGSVISMIGDLAASAIKRNHDIKDYGTLIPGHGGIMDRFDSVIFTAPIIYFMSEILL